MKINAFLDAVSNQCLDSQLVFLGRSSELGWGLEEIERLPGLDVKLAELIHDKTGKPLRVDLARAWGVYSVLSLRMSLLISA